MQLGRSMIYVNGGDDWWPAALGLIGVAVGGFASLAGTVLADYLRNRPHAQLAKIRRDTLKRRLAASNSEWVPMSDLADCIGADRNTTVQHLLMIGARRSMKANDVWGMAGWPEPKN